MRTLLKTKQKIPWGSKSKIQLETPHLQKELESILQGEDFEQLEFTPRWKLV